MTSELRPAVEVWDDIDKAFNSASIKGSPILSEMVSLGNQAAAAVIEADREAVRAPLLAEIERLRKLIEATSAHFLRLNTDHPIMWEGAIDAAMEAICLEVGRQAAELAKFKALAETLAGALDEWVFRYYWRHEGMNTEHARIYAKAQTEMMLRQYKEARDAS